MSLKYEPASEPLQGAVGLLDSIYWAAGAVTGMVNRPLSLQFIYASGLLNASRARVSGGRRLVGQHLLGHDQ